MTEKSSFLLPGQSLENKGTSMIIYSEAGAGKTSLVKTLLGWTYEGGWGSQEPYCKPEEILVIDVDSGTSVLARDDETLACTVLPIAEEKVKDFKDKLLPYLVTNIPAKLPFKFVFFDNMSEYEKYLVLGLAKGKSLDLPRMKEWGDASVYLRKHMRELKSLTFKGVNVIFNFWNMLLPQEQKDGTQTNIMCPMCMRKSWTEYTGIVDHYAYMGIDASDKANPTKRYLQFGGGTFIKAKRRSEKLKNFEKPNLGDIFRRLNEKAKSTDTVN